ncbi:MAG: 16S rRNA (uracil(1498)-N(3))-methyltransferase [Flavobacterium sp.]|nr:16S rRNA (uracil(1498)-N(3))-methyltransferase [Flavobacterium sp.]
MFYNPDIDLNTESFFFNKEESKHIVKVNRKQSGDILLVTNGLGILFTTEITLASDSKCTVKVINKKVEPKLNYQLHLAVAPTKMNERFEWFLEKATEIGISEITPIICDHSERKVINKERFEKIILSAMKQSNQYYLPKLNDAISFSDFISKSNNDTKFVAHCEEENNKKSLNNTLKPNENVTILIGPEGDFSEKEITLALQKKYIPVSLGKTRLRTETAAIVACHSAAFVNENEI